MGNIKDHVVVLSQGSGILPGGTEGPLIPPHAPTHELGGNDIINLEGLEGLLADPQDAGWLLGIEIEDGTPGNGDVLAYNATFDEWQYQTGSTPGPHATSHEDGGTDEIDVDNLDGRLSDPQDTDYDLDDIYHNSIAGVTVDVDEGDITFNLDGAYSINIDLENTTPTSDGFQIYNTTDYFKVLQNAVGEIYLLANVESILFEPDVYELNAFTSINVTTEEYIVTTSGTAEIEYDEYILTVLSTWGIEADEIEIVTTGIIDINSDGSININVNSNDLELTTTISGLINVNAANNLSLVSAVDVALSANGGNADIFGSVDININANTDLNLGGRGSNTPLNESGEEGLTGYTNVSIIGALNEAYDLIFDHASSHEQGGSDVLDLEKLLWSGTPPASGSLLFLTGGLLNTDASNLFWNDSTDRLGIGTNAPETDLEIYNSTESILRASVSSTEYMELLCNNADDEGIIKYVQTDLIHKIIFSDDATAAIAILPNDIVALTFEIDGYAYFGETFATSHALGSNGDLGIEGDCEIDGSLYVDTNVEVDGQIYTPLYTLTDGATITPDWNNGNVQIVTLAGNRTLANPSNIEVGATYIIIVVQDGTPPRTLSYGGYYKWPGGTSPTLSTGANDIDVLTFVAKSATELLGLSSLDFS